MATVNVNLQDIQIRRNLASAWTSNNPILLDGELGYEFDTNLLKIGNGVDDWNTRPYLTGSGGGLSEEEIESLINQVIAVDPNYLAKQFDAPNGVLTLSLPQSIINKLNNLPNDQGSLNSTLQTAIDSKQDPITITTSGSSGQATFNAGVLNIPQYSGSGTTNNYNNTYLDRSDTNLAGAIDGVNKIFTVSQGEYRSGSLLVFIEGIGHYNGAGITETNPAAGTFEMTTAPETASQLGVVYEKGVLGGTPVSQILSIVGDQLSLDNGGGTITIPTGSGGNTNANKHSTTVESADFTFTAAHQEVQTGSLEGAKVNTDINAGDVTATIDNLDAETTQAYRGNIKSSSASLTLVPGAGVTLDGTWKTGSETQITVLGKGSYSVEETEVDGTFWIIADNFSTEIPFSSGEYSDSDPMSSNEANIATNWSGVGNVSVASSTTEVDTGTYSLALTQSASGTFESANNTITLPFSTTYTLSIKLWAPTSSLDVGLRLRQNDGTGNSTIGSGYINGNDDWQDISFSFTTLASGDVTVQLQISESEDNYINNGNSPVTVYYDTISITQ